MVADFDGLNTLLTGNYERNGWKVVMVSAFARAEYEVIVKSGQEVRVDLGENAPWKKFQATSEW